ncbi:unnamed protein product [Pelagomonas calceolata]|uniref:RING-type domain-containing protein n=1 Tax=Pelagomonas calceolata TaxID=35677 RepID=A0A7S4A5R2_9STRA|nr:unnamed protein product [Pelagomonas calceolata]|mmetsp:Transcript_3821/g.11797  ORF Transcript_3821/g.11797 Transcript_3821/m.11797 type:complete len:423 (+) Transcript_3821:496-1764(+)
MLGQGKLIERAIRVAAQETGMEGTEVEKVVEETTQLARQQKETFIRQMRLYYYKQILLEDITSAGVPDLERLIMRRAIYFLTEDLFMGISSKVRRAMSKGKAKLRKVCKEVFLSVDRNVEITHPKDDEEATVASRSTEEPEPPRDNRADEADFVPSVWRLVVDLVPMLDKNQDASRTLGRAQFLLSRPNYPGRIEQVQRCFDAMFVCDINFAEKFNRCVERQRDEFRQQATESQRYKPTDLGLPLRRRCDNCGVDNALAEWRYPYCNSCNVYWLSPNFRKMDRPNGCCPICLLPPKSAEFSYTLRCGHTLHWKCLEYAKSVRAECPGEKILSVCPVCRDPITDDLEKVVFVEDVWPEHMGLWPGAPDPHDVAFVAERAAKGAYLAAKAAVRYARKKVSDAIAMGVWEDIWRGREADTDSLGA